MTALHAFKNAKLAPRFKFRNRESCESKLIDKSNFSESVISTVDLSPSGIAFLNSTKHPLKIGETAMVELAPFGAQPIRSYVRIIRSKIVTDETVLYGAQFIALPLLHQERLDKMIRSAHTVEQIDNYVENRHLNMRMDPIELAHKLTWIALILTATFTASRLLDMFVF